MSDVVVGTMGGETLNDALARGDGSTIYTHRVCPKCEGMLYRSEGWYFCGCGFITRKSNGLFDMRADFLPTYESRRIYPCYAKWHQLHFGKSVEESLRGV